MGKRKVHCLDPKALVRRKTFDGSTWSSWETLLERGERKSFKLQLSEGGTLSVLPDFIPKDTQRAVTDEIKKSEFFRNYSIQGVLEPRTHFLLHDEATENFYLEPQPGYRYGMTTMKSRPLKKLMHLSNLSDSIRTEFGVEKWNLGVNPVLYRGSKDRMGWHADDDQGETLIIAAIVESPHVSRCIEIRNKPEKIIGRRGNTQKAFFPTGKRREVIELFLGAGDVYSMDGAMQKEYVHCVHIPNVEDSMSKDARLTVVFRDGDLLHFARDSGQPNFDLSCPKPLSIHFGHVQGIEEGRCYSRTELLKTGAHRMAQRGISGNCKEGCDAVIVSGTRLEGQENDSFEELVYAAEKRVGAGSLLQNLKNENPIRIFRSSSLINSYRANTLESGKKSYRYDGLYKIEKCECTNTEVPLLDVNENETTRGAPSEAIWLFALKRVQKGSDLMENRKSFEEFSCLFSPYTSEKEAEESVFVSFDGNMSLVQQARWALAHIHSCHFRSPVRQKGPKCHRFRSLPRCQGTGINAIVNSPFGGC